MNNIRLMGFNSSIVIDLDKLTGSQINKVVQLCGEYSDLKAKFDNAPCLSVLEHNIEERMNATALTIKNLMYQGRV